MKSPKNFEKIAILKIWQLVFYWDVKTYFGILPLKWCIFRHSMYDFNVIQLRFRHTKHLKMTVWISVLWKVSMQLPKKWPQWLKNGNFWNFFFLQNWKTQLSKNIWIYIIAFDTIEIWTQQAPQNGLGNLSFVKDTNVVGNKWPERVLKWPSQKVVSLISERTL